jgi:hypothetical protein
MGSCHDLRLDHVVWVESNPVVQTGSSEALFGRSAYQGIRMYTSPRTNSSIIRSIRFRRVASRLARVIQPR